MAVELEYPFSGRWIVRNSPADRVPSHGTSRFATTYAIDFVPVDSAGRTAPLTYVSLMRPEAPERFPGFGRQILAPIDGIVLAAHDGEPDHPAYRGLPSIRYALGQRGRAAAGWPGLAGNHVLIENDGVVVALCHLQHGSVAFGPGRRVTVGEPLARCGNSGNSTEPHIHVQVMDSADAVHANALPLTFGGVIPRNGEIVGA